MTLLEQAEARVALARQIGREPHHWIATAAVAFDVADVTGHLAGVPVEVGEPRSSWGLELRCAPVAAAC